MTNQHHCHYEDVLCDIVTEFSSNLSLMRFIGAQAKRHNAIYLTEHLKYILESNMGEAK